MRRKQWANATRTEYEHAIRAGIHGRIAPGRKYQIRAEHYRLARQNCHYEGIMSALMEEVDTEQIAAQLLAAYRAGRSWAAELREGDRYLGTREEAQRRYPGDAQAITLFMDGASELLAANLVTNARGELLHSPHAHTPA